MRGLFTAMIVKMMATFRVFYNLQIWMPTNGRQMVEIDVNSKNSVFRQMEQMDDKWTTNGRQMVKNSVSAQIWQEKTNGRAYVLIYAPICSSA